MTPQQKIKWAILARIAEWEDKDKPVYPLEKIDQEYDALVEEGKHWDAQEETRSGGIKTGLECDYSRHYESDAVAIEMPDGSWVGWTYFHGGGKHGEPSEVEWMGRAYDVKCVEEEKMVVVRTFSKAEK